MTKTTADRHAMHRAWMDNSVAIVYKLDHGDNVKLRRENTYIIVEKPKGDEGGDAYEIELPPVGDCKGLVFFVKMIDPDTGDKDVTVKTQDDALTTQISEILHAADDYIAIENVAGEIWVEVSKEISTSD